MLLSKIMCIKVRLMIEQFRLQSNALLVMNGFPDILLSFLDILVKNNLVSPSLNFFL